MMTSKPPWGVVGRLLSCLTLLFAIVAAETFAQSPADGAAAGGPQQQDAQFAQFLSRVAGSVQAQEEMIAARDDDSRRQWTELVALRGGEESCVAENPPTVEQLDSEPVARIAAFQSSVLASSPAKAPPIPGQGRFWVLFILPVVLPLLPPMLIAPSVQRSRRWYPLLMALWALSMVVSLIEIAIGGQRAMAANLLAVPPIIVPCFFLLPLCQSFMDGVDAGREALHAASGASAWKAFRNVLAPRCLAWSAIWVGYLVALELLMNLRLGGGNWIGSAICANLAVGMFATCFLFARQTVTLRGMTMATGLTSSAIVLLFIAAAVWMIAAIGTRQLGFGLIAAPLISIGFAICFAAAMMRDAVRKGDRWFA